jgi:hypothetical protein
MALRRLCIAAVFALGALAAAGCTSSSSAAKDVTISGCNASPTGGRPTATGMIDNHSSKASTYAVTVSFYDSSGNRVSEGAATVGKVESGAVANFSAEGVASAKGPVTCKATSVVRTEAP